uniref:Cysteine--tRNA ligase n=1 Tax=uncultured marine thaumarchaeote KM3_69_B11 TaxID=1456244 RepID=A0A075HIE5_9ARCH|nr:cysteinyl-tRNA synthetase (CARS, cysS) [uncultured marine thaumarchaeote KM3_69_B11]
MLTIKIHDTLTNSKNELEINKKIRIYLCGVTVYDDSHIGHARTIIIFDTLRRFLESKKIHVELIQNFTDVDDKIIKRANDENVEPSIISDRFIKNYFDDFSRLNIKNATQYPKATEHIPDMINLIQNLIEKEFAYVAKNGVYFKVAKFTEYGKLSKKKTEDLESGARIEIDESKDSPLDFALWKFSETIPFWDSPWGKGRPGWHIECSAMSIKYLGENFDIHGGGRDLIFPHHENEIAQSESFTGKQFAKTWMHAGMITINGEKMSKSLGNIKSVNHVLTNWGPNVIRLFCMSGHYSKPIDYTEDLLKENLVKWRQVETCYYELILGDGSDDVKTVKEMIESHERKFDDAMSDDFNTSLALTSFFDMIKELNALASEEKISKQISDIAIPILDRLLNILGLKITKVTDKEKASIIELIKNRDEMRIKKQFDEADEIRDKILSLGITLIDHKSKTLWMKKEIIKSDS